MPTNCPSCGHENDDGAAACRFCQLILKKEAPKPAGAARSPFEAMARQVVERSGQDLLLMGLGIELDYSPASVRGIDAALDAMYGSGGDAPGQEYWTPSQGKQGLILAYGAYFGEVCRRMLDGAWEEDPEHPKDPLWVRIACGDSRIFPIARVFKRLKNGSEDALFVVMESLAQDLPDVRRSWGRGYLKQAGLIYSRGAMPAEQRLPVALEFCGLAAAFDPALAGEASALAGRIAAAPPRPSQAEPGLARSQVGVAPAANPSPSFLSAPPAPETGSPEALAPLMRACELAPENLACWKALAALMQGLKKLSESADCWKRVTELAPQDPEAWRQRGWTCCLAGRLQEAEDSLTRSLELAPGVPEVLLEKIVVKDRAGDRVQALIIAAAVLAIPENLATLRTRKLQDYAYLFSPDMSPELKTLLAERLG
ncbi:MAG: hypothetical protein WC943_17655 [Elusimicrobiota bacterium]